MGGGLPSFGGGDRGGQVCLLRRSGGAGARWGCAATEWPRELVLGLPGSRGGQRRSVVVSLVVLFRPRCGGSGLGLRAMLLMMASVLALLLVLVLAALAVVALLLVVLVLL